MFEFLKSEAFNIVGSMIIGIGIMAVFKPACKENCEIRKAPAVEEVVNTTYQIGTKCYQFKTTETVCPETGVIESFQVQCST
jgi:hypothetical protein